MLFCTNPPFIRDISAEFPEHKAFEQNYKKITDEYNQYIAKNPAIDCFRNNNPLLREIDTIDKEKDYCWRTLYLKKGGHMIPETVSAFPLTAKLLANDQIDNAFFSILDPHVEIKPHTGYYKGYLRYHVGLIIPEEGGQRPYIVCGGERYEWTEGKGVLFDDMYLHYVNNPTSKPRVILYLDIKRRGMPYFLQGVTDFGNYLIENSVILQFFVKNQHQQSALV
jgi:beta-hydroxylase